MLAALLPHNFFASFNKLRGILGLHSIAVVPDIAEVRIWNEPEFVPTMVEQIVATIDSGQVPHLVPALVEAYYQLENGREPRAEDWEQLVAIVVAGSRSRTRTGRAAQLWHRTSGKSWIILTGNAPSYDQNNEGIGYSEAEIGASHLRLLGIPEEKLILESKSHNTLENTSLMLRKLQTIAALGPQKILLVTSDFHLARFRFYVEMATLQGRMSGIDVFALGAKPEQFHAETYFLDPTRRTSALTVVLNEYLKIAFTLCACEV
jgi:uncharacterized SAM-binding protein YcdF (DUF218 family)